jgi:hypothetical protein
MIGFLIAAIALMPFVFDAAPEKKAKSDPCPPDTVYYHIKVTRDWALGIPVETVDTTWVVRTGGSHGDRDH